MSERLRKHIPEDGWLGMWQRTISERASAPPEFIFASGLAALSATIGNRVYFKLGGRRSAHLWLLLLAPAGAKKSTPATFAREAVEGARSDDAMLSRRWSPEAFYKALDRCHDGFWDAGELSAFLDSSKKRDYMAGARMDLCDIWDGYASREIRKEKIAIRDAAVTALATARASDFGNASALGDMQSGFLTRWLVVTAEDPGRYVGVEDDFGSIDHHDPAFKALVDDLKRLRFAVAGADASTPPERSRWSDAARRLFNEIDEPWTRQELPDELTGWGARRGIYMAKLAILHALSRTGRAHVEASDVSWGRAIVDTCFTDVRAVVSDVAGATVFSDVRRKIIARGKEMADADGVVSVRDWMRAVFHMIRGARDFDDLLAALEASGQVELTKVQPEGGGRPSRRARFTPTLRAVSSVSSVRSLLKTDLETDLTR